MDMSIILEALLPTLDRSPSNVPSRKFDETTCGALCQHPACWASVRRQQKGIAQTVSTLDLSSDESDCELDLPKQSICNLLEDYGESPTDRYPMSTGGRPSHQWDGNSHTVTKSSRSLDTVPKLKAPYNSKGSLFSKSTTVSTRRGRVPLVEVQEVFDKTDLNSQWDETFVTKQYYMWVPNPRKGHKKKIEMPASRETYQSVPLLMKDLTECMVPPEIEQKREDTIMFDEWPVLKKKQPRTRSPPSRSVQFKKVPVMPVPPVSDLDTEGINELLALPKDALMKVLEHTKRSDFTSKGKLRTILQEYVQYDERARMALNTRELFQPRKMQILKQSTGSNRIDPNKPPFFHLDDEMIIDRMSSVNTPVKDKDTMSDAHSVDSFPRYRKPLPKIHGSAPLDKREIPMVDFSQSLRMPPRKSRIPAISLGLPELPSGVKTTRAFSYNKKSLVDFSLGPVISPPSTERSSLSGAYSEHGTTVKVHASSTAVGYMGEERTGDYAIHSVSPALSTHVPQAPAVTPATFMSPTKSAPALRDYKDLSRDPTHTSISLSQKAMPPSRDLREATLLSSMPSNVSQRPIISPMDTKMIGTPDDLALDTINETARENVDGSLASSQLAVADVNDPVSARRDEIMPLALEPSALTSINTGISPVQKSARSVESCPSPEQWPLISESSFEKIMPRPSVSEPALSARSRHFLPRGLDEDLQGPERDYARKVLDEKMTAESPAPPPPSPEPKDREFRSRKDLKSRDSLSMAPLFEVNEVEEGSPVNEMLAEERKNGKGRNGERRMKQMRQIHAVIPQAKVEQDKREETEENDDVMVSQITVTHVTPKGPDPNLKKGEKVQETFLNVDIPAEEISSLKAEHGSSLQEDISSNDTVVQSQSTTTGSEVSESAAAPGSVPKEDEHKREPENVESNKDQMTDSFMNMDSVTDVKDQTLTIEHDALQRENSAKPNSEDSALSPELICDSARFLNHEMVSPVDGELEDDEPSRMLPLLSENNGEEAEETTAQDTMRTHTVEDDTNAEDKEHKVAVRPDENEEREEIQRKLDADKTTENIDQNGPNTTEQKTAENGQSIEIEPPGSFFFQMSSSSGTPQDNGGEADKIPDAKAEDDVEKEPEATDEPGTNNESNEIIKEEEEILEREAQKDVNQDDVKKDIEQDKEEQESSVVTEEKEITQEGETLDPKENTEREQVLEACDGTKPIMEVHTLVETDKNEGMEEEESIMANVNVSNDGDTTKETSGPSDKTEENEFKADISMENEKEANTDAKDGNDVMADTGTSGTDYEENIITINADTEMKVENSEVGDKTVSSELANEDKAPQDMPLTTDSSEMPQEKAGIGSEKVDLNENPTDSFQPRLEPEGSDDI